MKKTLLLITALCGAAIQAQTANVSLTVKLTPIMGISVNQSAVNINVDTEQEYLEGAETLISDHIQTFSTVGYKVSAKYLSSEFEPNTIGIKASSVNGATYTRVSLTDASQTIISSPLGKGRKFHDVEYTVKRGLWDITSGDYVTSIQYEITAL